MNSNSLANESRLNWRNVFYMLAFFVLMTLPAFAQSDDANDLTVDDAKAIVEVMQQKADNGDVEMQVTVAKFYDMFIYGALDNLEPVLYATSMVKKYSKMAADEGNADGMTLYAQRLADDGDLANAYEWYRMASNLGNGDATCAIGRFYLFGEEQLGIKEDETKAYEYLRKSAEQKSPEGMAWLGFYYERIAQNYPEATKWYQESAELGCSFGMASLCYSYFVGGMGVDINLPVAYMWYKKARTTCDASFWMTIVMINDITINVKRGHKETVAFMEYCRSQGDELKPIESMEFEDYMKENQKKNK